MNDKGSAATPPPMQTGVCESGRSWKKKLDGPKSKKWTVQKSKSRRPEREETSRFKRLEANGLKLKERQTEIGVRLGDIEILKFWRDNLSM